MSSQYLGELRLVAFNFAPKGWSLCNGQLVAINQNQALFALLGTYYGGDGMRTFALPQLQGRTPISMGNGFNIGQIGGEESHTLTTTEVPPHSHPVNAMQAASPAPGGNSPAGNYLGGTTGALGIYADASQASGTLNTQTVTMSGGNQPHENRQPYLVMNWVIALQGIFPTRN